MTSSYGKKQEKYSAFTDTLQQATRNMATESGCTSFLLWGDDDYLLRKSSLFLFAQLQKYFQEYGTTKLDLKDLDAAALQNLFEQQSLFDDGHLYLIQRCEQKSNFEKYLQQVKSSNSANKFIFTLKKPTLGKKVENECKRLNWQIIECVPPPSYRIPYYIQQSAKQYKLKISISTANYIQTMLGDNLAIIDNELNRLSLIFADEARELSEEDLAKHCHLLRQEDAFKLADLIMSGQQAKAESSLQKLLNDGIAPLSLIGVIARLLRTTAYLKSPVTAGQVRLPPRIKEKYLKFGQKISVDQLKAGIAACQEADMQLKSSRANGIVSLVQIVNTVRS